MTIAKLAPLLAALILAACQSAPPPPVVAAPPEPEAQQGLDLSIDTGQVLNELKGSHVDFVARYYRDPDSHLPPLSALEAHELSEAGLKIVAVWEWHARDPSHFTYASGVADAQMAYQQAKAVGQPPGSAIYFAIDFNTGAAPLGPVNQYFRGIDAGLAQAAGGKSEYQVGVYGSGAVCDALKRAGLAQYAWLSNANAWAGSAEYDAWDIRQGPAWPDLSFSHDTDEAKAEYGGFRVNDPAVAAAPAATPAPTTPPAVAAAPPPAPAPPPAALAAITPAAPPADDAAPAPADVLARRALPPEPWRTALTPAL